MSQQKSQQVSQQWFSPNEVAFSFNVDRRTIYWYMRDGKLPYKLLPSGRRRIHYIDMNKFLGLSTCLIETPKEMTVRQSAIYLGISRFLLYRLIQKGYIKEKYIKNKKFLLKEDLDSLLKSPQ